MFDKYRKPLVLLIVALSLALLVACAWPLGQLALGEVPSMVPTPTPQPAPALPVATQGQVPLPNVSISAVVQQVRPAVVQIINKQVLDYGYYEPVEQQAGIGSGVIYDSQGYILTNYHVIEGADGITVALPDGRSFDNATIVGTDRRTDLAVVQIPAEDLPVARLGNSAALQVGDWVVAIGNALGLKGGPTVTAGVVSALGRVEQEPSSAYGVPGPYLYDLIQTDAAINPGNSGGPLINLQGEVVGINTLVAGVTGSGYQAQGIGFAIAVDTAKPIADEIVATGQVVHPYIGISYQWLGPALARRLGMKQSYGLIIAEVGRGSPAEQAGLRVRDVIVAIDGDELSDESSLQLYLMRHKPGDIVELKIIRSSSERTVRVVLGETSD
ncbi:MAG TPA: trypsin-like peptidase domain-containing protein [Anaerolineae bacterium]|nr:trypsin-like peptidase domain-containing protein [Anaerolineae bacterium]HOQ97611.1 trypsin-like peptidase domain-containing protein [Anaerolineae bacterium]HPL27380.1 trypsin-like peptidase domain-containing protein [Anaerolineae bacterium]